jgi:hypothetical protein
MSKLSFPLAFALAWTVAPAVAEYVGNVGAANPAAFGTPPGAVRRPLLVGLGVEMGERIDTANEGNAQIIFNDSSTLTVGRNSSLAIDEFVYQGGRGSQGVRLAKGVMRFVGGGVSHVSGAKLKTPTADVGVRGGSVLARIGGECGTLIVHQVGVVEVTGAGGSQTLTRPGFGVCATAAGVSEPFRVPAAAIVAITAEMASHHGQNGGARRKHVDESAGMLGDHAPPDVQPSPGLEALAPVWAGDAIVQSNANVNNQPSPTPSPPPPPLRQRPN